LRGVREACGGCGCEGSRYNLAFVAAAFELLLDKRLGEDAINRALRTLLAQ
jgi:hypothetical protein